MAFHWLRCSECRAEVPYEARPSTCDFCNRGHWRIISDQDGELPESSTLRLARSDALKRKLGI